MTHYTLADTDQKILEAWNALTDERLSQMVSIHHGSIFDVPCDALVSPANSFGMMDGGIDAVIVDYFGWGIEEEVQIMVLKKYHGEILVGQADIVPTNNATIPYLICAPTMRAPLRLRETVNPYLAVRAILLLMEHGTFADGTPIKDIVKRVALPGMGTGAGQVPAELFAYQMKRAFENVYFSPDGPEFPCAGYQARQMHLKMCQGGIE